jgi:hypothetical protein
MPSRSRLGPPRSRARDAEGLAPDLRPPVPAPRCVDRGPLREDRPRLLPGPLRLAKHHLDPICAVFGIDANTPPPYSAARCPGGGIGRRARLRIWCSQGRAGSTPVPGTTQLVPSGNSTRSFLSEFLVKDPRHRRRSKRSLAVATPPTSLPASPSALAPDPRCIRIRLGSAA